MRTTRRDILPLAESAVRQALRAAIREAILQVTQEKEVIESLTLLHRSETSRPNPQDVGPTPAPPMRTTQSMTRSIGTARAPLHDLTDEDAWERFDAIRFTRSAAS